MTLYEELKKLIEGSNSLQEAEKQALIIASRYLPIKEARQLKEIFQKEKEEFEKIENDYLVQSTEMNKRHIKEIRKLVVVCEEKDEASRTDQILAQLNNI